MSQDVFYTKYSSLSIEQWFACMLVSLETFYLWLVSLWFACNHFPSFNFCLQSVPLWCCLQIVSLLFAYSKLISSTLVRSQSLACRLFHSDLLLVSFTLVCLWLASVS